MEFNNARERAKLNRKWEKLRVQYRKLGMTEEYIELLYKFDLDELNSDRRYSIHNISVSGDILENIKFTSDEVLRQEILYTLTRYSWIECINNEELYLKLLSLSDEQIEILTLHTIYGYTQCEIAQKLGYSRENICKKLMKIKKFLKVFTK